LGRPRRRGARAQIAAVAVILIILGVAIVIAAIALLPLRPVNVTETRDVPSQAGVDVLKLGFAADVAQVNVAFQQLAGKAISLHVSVTGRGPLIQGSPYTLTFDHSTSGGVLTVNSILQTPGAWPRLLDLQVTCDLRIDPSMRSSLDIKTSVGRVVVDTRAGAVIDSLNVETTVGGAQANLVENTVLAGDVSVRSTTGGVTLSWRDVIVTSGLTVDLRTTTGAVAADLRQDERLRQTVTLRAEATTGGVDLAIDIRDDVAARIESSTSLGGIDIVRRVGFSGTESLLESNNYPAEGNFDVSLRTSTGGVRVDARYSP